jgi:hypothetical protein
MAKKTAQVLKKEFEQTLDPLEMLAILHKHIRTLDEGGNRTQGKSYNRREIILSGYQIAGAEKG